jgi:hypothetical protein
MSLGEPVHHIVCRACGGARGRFRKIGTATADGPVSLVNFEPCRDCNGHGVVEVHGGPPQITLGEDDDYFDDDGET